jgi:hypothetical protein
MVNIQWSERSIYDCKKEEQEKYPGPDAQTILSPNVK